MNSIALLRVGETAQIWDRARPRIGEATTLQEAMQGVMDLLYEEFQDTLVLVRAFITVPYALLPDVNRSFVSDLLSKQGIAEEPSRETPVLSLIGTRGWEAEWNEVAASNGHLGIPLVSNAFVAQIPMVSRLLTDLGLGADLSRHMRMEIVYILYIENNPTPPRGLAIGRDYTEVKIAALRRETRKGCRFTSIAKFEPE